MVKREDVSVKQILPSGAISVYSIVDGHYTEQQFIGYTVDEAIEMYLKIVKEQAIASEGVKA